MPEPADFRLYHSNSLEVLAGLMASELRHPAPGQSLLAPDIVLVPQVAMRRWLQATLAQTYGIAANLEFLTPGEFVARALDANVPGAADDLDAAALRWRLYAALTDPAVLREPAMAALKAYLRDDAPAGGDALKPWSLAGELAAIFEKYQAWRRDWLLGWEAGQAPRDPQALLWRRVAGGGNHRARRIHDYLDGFASPASPLPAGLPPRLFAFATLNVSPDVLRVIATQARVGVMHFYLPTPTRSYWGDLQTLRERLRSGAADPFAPAVDAVPVDEGSEGEPVGDLFAEPVAAGADPAADAENRLLQAWGAAGRDFMAVLGSYEVVHPSGEIPAYEDPEERAGGAPLATGGLADTLLKRLHGDLFHRRGAPSGPLRAAVDSSDPSVQVHACHTPLREVQVLHDQVRGLLEDPRFDPPLQPREIAVLAPDIDPYAPYIEAVFGGRAGHDDFIAYALADTSPLAGEPLAEVFVRLLALPVSRFGLHEILDLLASPPIAAAAGLDEPALERLRDWLQAAGARWGLDAAHRVQQQAPRDDAYTWAFALDRLLLGHASGAAGEIAGVAPWPELEGGALAALDSLIRLLRVLARHQRVLGEAMTPAQWRERLLGLLDAVLPQSPADIAGERALERLRKLVDDFAADAQRAGFAAPVPPEVVRAHFAATLADADTRAPLLTGGISFGRMVPMRLLPFRVICVLGMNDGDYPRRDPAAGLNQLTAELGTGRRRHGDRSLREDDRFLFLQLFASAAEVFYLSYLGADPRDGSVREPSVLVTELLDAAAAYHADPAAAARALVVRHPLQPFAPTAFGGGGEPRRFSYRREWHPAADRVGGARQPLAAWFDGVPLVAAADRATPAEHAGGIRAPVGPDGARLAAGRDELSLDDLRRFLCDPAGQFLRQRLGLRLPEDSEATDDTEPLLVATGGLERAALQQAVLAALVHGDDTDLYRRLRARALLPSGPVGERQFEAELRHLRPYAEQFLAWRGDAAPKARRLEVEVDGLRLHGRVEEIYPAGLARIRVGKLNGPAAIRHGLEWLLASAAGEAWPLVQFHEDELGSAAAHVRGPLPAARARDLLRTLVQLRARGLAEPLPFGPYSGWDFYCAPHPDKARAAAELRWHGSDRQWGEGQGDAPRLALRGRDPFADDDGFAAFRDISLTVFHALVDGRQYTADTEEADA